MSIEKRDIVFEAWNLLFKLFTFGYVAEIILIILIIILVFTMVYLFAYYRIFSFLVKDRVKFAKQYIYLFVNQNTNFIKYYFRAVWKNINKPKLIFIILTIIIIVVVCVYLFIYKT